jgi:hypothetical protein
MPNPSPTLAQENHWRAKPDLGAYSCATSQGSELATFSLQEGVLSLTVLGADSPASRCSSDHQPRHCPNKVGYALRTRCRSSSSSSMLCSLSYSTTRSEAGTRPRRTSLLMRVSMRLIPWFRFQLGWDFLLPPSALSIVPAIHACENSSVGPIGHPRAPTDLISSSCDLTLPSLSCLRHVRTAFRHCKTKMLAALQRRSLASASCFVHPTAGNGVILGLRVIVMVSDDREVCDVMLAYALRFRRVSRLSFSRS